MRACTLAAILLQNPDKEIHLMDPLTNDEYRLHGVATNNDGLYLYPEKKKSRKTFSEMIKSLRTPRN